MKSPRFACLVLSLVPVDAGVAAAQSSRTPEEHSRQKDSAESKTEKTGTARRPEKVQRTDQQWREILTRQQFKVLREKGTEPPFRNKYDKHFESGKYACAACGQELFSSETKFNSGCGWPAFYAAMAGERVVTKLDFSLGMIRTEVICARCDSHLGHVFRDAPQTPTRTRFCINSVSLKFIPVKSKATGTRPRAVEKNGEEQRSQLRPEKGTEGDGVQ